MGVDTLLPAVDDDGAVGDVVRPFIKDGINCQGRFSGPSPTFRNSKKAFHLQQEYANAGNNSTDEEDESDGRSVTVVELSVAVVDDISDRRRGPLSSDDDIVFHLWILEKVRSLIFGTRFEPE